MQLRVPSQTLERGLRKSGPSLPRCRWTSARTLNSSGKPLRKIYSTLYREMLFCLLFCQLQFSFSLLKRSGANCMSKVCRGEWRRVAQKKSIVDYHGHSGSGAKWRRGKRCDQLSRRAGSDPASSGAGETRVSSGEIHPSFAHLSMALELKGPRTLPLASSYTHLAAFCKASRTRCPSASPRASRELQATAPLLPGVSV